jgi:putative transcriptional regulator
MSKHELTNNLKVLRAKHSLTQEELAVKVGVSRKTINVIEGGNYAPSILLALEIAHFFELPVEEVFGYEDSTLAV